MSSEHDCKSVNTRVDSLEKWSDKHDEKCEARSEKTWQRFDDLTSRISSVEARVLVGTVIAIVAQAVLVTGLARGWFE